MNEDEVFSFVDKFESKWGAVDPGTYREGFCFEDDVRLYRGDQYDEDTEESCIYYIIESNDNWLVQLFWWVGGDKEIDGDTIGDPGNWFNEKHTVQFGSRESHKINGEKLSF